MHCCLLYPIVSDMLRYLTHCNISYIGVPRALRHLLHCGDSYTTASSMQYRMNMGFEYIVVSPTSRSTWIYGKQRYLNGMYYRSDSKSIQRKSHRCVWCARCRRQSPCRLAVPLIESSPSPHVGVLWAFLSADARPAWRAFDAEFEGRIEAKVLTLQRMPPALLERFMRIIGLICKSFFTVPSEDDALAAFVVLRVL